MEGLWKDSEDVRSNLFGAGPHSRLVPPLKGWHCSVPWRECFAVKTFCCQYQALFQKEELEADGGACALPALSPLRACSFSRPIFILSWEKQFLPPLPPLGIGSDHQLERTCGDSVTQILVLGGEGGVTPSYFNYQNFLLWPLKVVGDFRLALLCRIFGGQVGASGFLLCTDT